MNAGETGVDARLTEIRRYPVKSCRGHRLEHAEVERCGLAGDRRWMVVHESGEMLTARKHPLVLVEPEITTTGLILRAPGMEPLEVRTPTTGRPVPTDVFGGVTAGLVADEATDWLSRYTGTPVRLIHLDDPDRRRVDPLFGRGGDRVSYADGYPLLLASRESLDALNELIAAGSDAGEGPLPMTRFRPNLVVAGAPAWTEDGWRRVRIGFAEFRVAKACARCVLTTVHPETAVKGREPLATLARHRRWGSGVWFAVNLIPDTLEVRLRVGDEVEVLEDAAREPPLGATG